MASRAFVRKYVAFGILFLLSLCGVFLFGISQVKAESAHSDLTLKISPVLSLSLSNCDSTNSSTLNLSIDPTPNGSFKSNCQTTNIHTNTPGYSLTISSSTSTLNYLNPTTITNPPTINSTTNTITSPNILTNDTWGFAAVAKPNFDTTYTPDNANNKYAALPTTNTTIYQTDQYPLPQTNHTFYYATRLTPETMAGTYAATITYTAIGADIPEPPCQSDGIICIEVTEPGTIAIQNIWATPITYSYRGSDPVELAKNAISTDLEVATGELIEIAEKTENVSFRSWSNSANRGFVTNTTSSGTAKVAITKMPAINRFTTDEAGTTAGNYFFRYFAGTSSSTNYPATIASLPTDSFNTSNITSAGSNFFYSFNDYGSIISLPSGSFDISKITAVGDNFFRRFNHYGSLTSFPAGSFDTSSITSAGDSFFESFITGGTLASLPAGSFDTSSITSAGDYFFGYFNSSGALISLPIGGFDTSNIMSIGVSFFEGFNWGGKLQAGTGVTITNKASSSVTFDRRPEGDPDGEETSTDVPAGGAITYLGT